jgi:hypothetical protein
MRENEPSPVKNIGVRFPIHLLQRIYDLAKQEKRSFNAQVLYILQSWLDQKDQEKA